MLNNDDCMCHYYYGYTDSKYTNASTTSSVTDESSTDPTLRRPGNKGQRPPHHKDLVRKIGTIEVNLPWSLYYYAHLSLTLTVTQLIQYSTGKSRYYITYREHRKVC